jgi:hypothetical protein
MSTKEATIEVKKKKRKVDKKVSFAIEESVISMNTNPIKIESEVGESITS